jgi:hypothetical protein
MREYIKMKSQVDGKGFHVDRCRFPLPGYNFFISNVSLPKYLSEKETLSTANWIS